MNPGCADLLSLSCWHTQSMDVKEGSDQNVDLQPSWIHQHGCFKEASGICNKYQNLMWWVQIGFVVVLKLKFPNHQGADLGCHKFV